MWRKIECVAIYTQDIEKSIRFYEMLGLTKSWDIFQDEQNKWRLVGMTFSDGNSELVLKIILIYNFLKPKLSYLM